MGILHVLALFLVILQIACGSDNEEEVHWKQKKSYFINSSGDRYNTEEALRYLGFTKHIKTSNTNIINSYINSLFLSFVNDAKNIKERIEFYKSTLSTNQDGPLTALILLIKMSGEGLDNYLEQSLFDNRPNLLKTINHYYDIWAEEFLPNLKEVKSEAGKMLLTFASPFGRENPVTLEVLEIDIPYFSNDAPTITITVNNMFKIKEEADGETLRILDFNSEKVLFQILQECKKEQTLHALYIEPEREFIVDDSLQTFWQNLQQNELKNLTTLHIPYNGSGFNELKGALERNCLPQLLSGPHFKLFFMHLSPQPNNEDIEQMKQAIEEIIKNRL